MRRRLPDDIAKKLGLEVKKGERPGVNRNYYLNKERQELYEKLMGKPVSEKKPRDMSLPFVLSAWNSKGHMMDIDEYCEFYSLPRQDIKSYKLVSHTGTPFYNILFKEIVDDSKSTIKDYESIKQVLEDEFKRSYKYTQAPIKKDIEAVLKIADLHFGAMIADLLRTKDFDSNILKKYLNRIVTEVNSFGFKKVHVHIHGDLIESFSGLNHINSWMSLNKDEVGANAVKLCTKMLDEFLRCINNLGEIKIVAGNHDRISQRNDEDVKGGAADLIAWGLELIGYSVEFNPMIITHLVDDINHLILHGDKAISKQDTEKIIWDYGLKGKFNYITEAHLHSLIEKLSVKQRNVFKTLKDDALDHRRKVLPPLFTGNFYSESLGYTSNAGFEICYDSGGGKLNTFNYTL